ncbi:MULTISPECIES: hypothetical protein [Sphingobium]|jgi:hypothetical protein|uniref:Uncharacterized protein n=1 Tax=Sphingobium limneticum TaxID=1007511 RepID=A0A5J5IBB7_9SPHN|nr:MULTISPECIES: hypothetical protein [Sphingobium]KAA9020132.1 hypothetical protein F4U94_00640 [Sphingobium limneticum]KAA9021388.1 hypothetical protein F4U96_01455 [Sphingobium limneticum]KAA9033750.1 hypothetical protein F4U95_01455 [Sphingobium limneticum]BBD03213.1 hypothetical protein YGS_C2P1227 [Sphingobium sp. YG1]
MFGIGGFNPVSLLATAALGPLGGIVAQLAQQVVSQLGQQLVGQLGQQLGLSQGIIQDAQQNFTDQLTGFQGGSATDANDAISQLGETLGASPTEIGQAQNDFQNAIDDILSNIAGGDDVKDARAGGTGKAAGWLMAMAKELGGKMDSMAKDIEKLSKKADGKNPGASTEFTAMSQQFGILSNAAATGLKAIGEAMSNMARKQ